MKPSTTTETEQLEQECLRLETNLLNAYCDAGKLLMEIAEEESRKINLLVEQVIALRQQLQQRCKETIPRKENEAE